MGLNVQRKRSPEVLPSRWHGVARSGQDERVSEHSSRKLDEIEQALTETIRSFEGEIARLRQRAGAVLEETERERSRVQARIEELLIDRLPEGSGEVDRLRQVEERLTAEVTRASALNQQLTDFLQLLSVTRQQVGERGILPGLDDAQRLTIRQAMIRAQEDERRRLAREIHDGPAQALANAILSVQFAARVLARSPEGIPAPLREELERIEHMLREGLNETRRFIVDLQPTILKQLGLLGTLHAYIDSYRRLFTGEIHLDLPETLPPLTPEQELAIFRIVQEALHNVQRHARARTIRLTIRVDAAEIVVRIEDDGQGFRPAGVAPTASSGFGLHGMRERAEVIGGQLTVDSAPGRGTVVTLVIPLGVTPGTEAVATQEASRTYRTAKERVG